MLKIKTRELKIYCYGKCNDFRFFVVVRVPDEEGQKFRTKEMVREKEIRIKATKKIKEVKLRFRMNSYGASFPSIKFLCYEGKTIKM